ncbi:LysM peptidoglycan-binding domain-containing protein [Leuconostoc pseudomesenteroides]|uniref:LysM peptidoglycan-binding domain-containing protein n=1 Tax=Leuconostoc pseudomesenteroides TaxID=33968 RepID=UPI0032DEB61A
MNDLNQSKYPCTIVLALLVVMLLSTLFGTSFVSANSVNWQANSIQQIKAKLPITFNGMTHQYDIQYGDTINGIAEALNVNANTVVAENQLSDANLIYTGKQLTITAQANGYVAAGGQAATSQATVLPTASLVSEFDGKTIHQIDNQ